MNQNLVEIENLEVRFRTESGVVHAVNGVNLNLKAGETLAIVGESGCGKSVTSLSLMGLHAANNTAVSGAMRVYTDTGVVDMATADESVRRKIRGKVVSMIFQDPMTSLHPFYSIGDQLGEAYLAHNPGETEAAKARALEMLELVRIPEAAKRINGFPHEFSGGMRQRVMIAMALMNSPKVLIADEPTTALDVTVQAQILQLLADVQKELNMAMILITHDLGVVAGVADEVAVMYAGRVVEFGDVVTIFDKPTMPYTRGLLASIPRIDSDRNARLETIPGQPPNMLKLADGCSFAPRCPYISSVPNARCTSELPELVGVSGNSTHLSRCFLEN